jgi:hypothetical protein
VACEAGLRRDSPASVPDWAGLGEGFAGEAVFVLVEVVDVAAGLGEGGREMPFVHVIQVVVMR